MGKRYYCDFCDKAFADNPASKKNHFNGTYHQQMRQAHYDAFKDPASILAAESTKKPCRRFLQTGVCDYGDGCRFSHLTDERRRELEEHCRQSQEKSRSGSSRRGGTALVIGSVDDWLVKRAKRRESGGASSEKRRKMLPEYSLPPHFTGVPNLPPSLLPPTKNDFVNLPLLEWG